MYGACASVLFWSAPQGCAEVRARGRVLLFVASSCVSLGQRRHARHERRTELRAWRRDAALGESSSCPRPAGAALSSYIRIQRPRAPCACRECWLVPAPDVGLCCIRIERERERGAWRVSVASVWRSWRGVSGTVAWYVCQASLGTLVWASPLYVIPYIYSRILYL